MHSLLLLDVPGTVVGIDAGILVRMRLHRVRIEYLQHLAEVDLLHQIVDVIIVKIVREHQQRLGNVACLRQADNQMAQIIDARVHLRFGNVSRAKETNKTTRSRTCTTIITESFCSGPNVSSFSTSCSSLYLTI